MIARWLAFGALGCALVAQGGASADSLPGRGDFGPAPLLAQAQAIGAPGHGCLKNGIGLPLEGPGYQVSRPERRRFFGHPDLIDFIEALARRAQAAGLPLLYVGDMALLRGGPIPDSSHRSHETGLDADFWFTPGPHYAPGAAEAAPPDPKSMLKTGGRDVDDGRFGPDQASFLRFALADPRVDRILVNPAIKRALCNGAAGAIYFGTDWLRRLEPFPGHDDHFHVRLRCPPGSPNCVPSNDLPEGDGCGAVALDRPIAPKPPNTHAALAIEMAGKCGGGQ